MTKLWQKIERLRNIEGLRIADITRRRHSLFMAGLVRSGDGRRLGGKICRSGKSPARYQIEAIGTKLNSKWSSRLADLDDDLPLIGLAGKEHEICALSFLTNGTDGFSKECQIRDQVAHRQGDFAEGAEKSALQSQGENHKLIQTDMMMH